MRHTQSLKLKRHLFVHGIYSKFSIKTENRKCLSTTDKPIGRFCNLDKDLTFLLLFAEPTGANNKINK